MSNRAIHLLPLVSSVSSVFIVLFVCIFLIIVFELVKDLVKDLETTWDDQVWTTGDLPSRHVLTSAIPGDPAPHVLGCDGLNRLMVRTVREKSEERGTFPGELS